MASKYDALIDDVAQPTVAEPPPVVQDKYGALIDEVTDTTPLHNSLFDATGTNPDQEVKNLKLAKELNTPAAILPADAEEQALLKRNNADDLTARSPATAKFLAKGTNAKVTGLQGVKSLEDVEAAYKTYSPENIKRFIDNYTSANKTAGEAAQRLTEMKKQGINLADELDPYRRETADIFKDPIKAAAAGANTMVAGLNEIGQFAPQQRILNAAIDAITPKRKELFLNVQAGLNENSEYWQGQKSPAMQKLNKEFEQAGIADSVSMLLEHPQLTADLLAVSTPYLVGGGLASKGGATTMSMYNALVEAGDAANTARQEAIKAGASEEDQDRAATIAVLITAPTVFLGNKLLGTGKLEADFFTKGSVGDNLLTSTIKEALSGAIEEGSNKFSTNVGASIYDDNRQLLEGVGKAALIGGILESTHAVGMSVAERSLRTFIKDVDQTVTNNGDAVNKAAEATAAHDTLESLGAKVADNELRTRSPEAFHEFVETMADEQQLQDVYIDGKVILEMLGDNYSDLRRTAPELVVRIEEAAALGNDVQLPVADYLTHIAGTPLEANVLGSLKADPAGATYKEAQTFYKDQEQVFQSEVQAVADANEEVLSREEFEVQKTEPKQTTVSGENETTREVTAEPLPATYEEYLAQHKNKREVYARDVDTVETNLYTQFAEAKRFTPTVNRAYVAPLVEFYKVQAKKFGVMPSELLRQYPLKVQAFLDFGTGFELNQLGAYQLEGLPETSVGPSGEVQDVAVKYMNDTGMDYFPQTGYVKADPERGARIAAEYEKMVDNPNDPEVKAAYEALAKETLAQYKVLKELGYTFDLIPEGSPDPYTGGPREALKDMKDNKHLWVFPTTSGFGQGESQAEGSVMLRPTDEYLNGKQLVVNDVFRIVHDVFGHAKDGVGFGPTGEENAWQSHVRMFSPQAARAMTTETRGQNSWVNFGPYGEQNRANQKETVYAEQKIGLLPKWVMTEGLSLGATPAGQMATVNPEMVGSLPAKPEVYQGLKVGQVVIKGVHYSNEKRTVLNGQYYGQGLKGAERDRVYSSKDSRIRSRVHFYVDEGKGIFPEYGVGNTPHTVTMANMYDGARNPLKLTTRNADGERDMNLFESAVIDAGFDGYYVEAGFGRQGVAVMLGDAARSVIPDSEKGTTLPDVEGVKARFAEELKNPDIEAIYNGRPDSLNGKVLNTDVARELSSDYLANRSLGATVHVQSNKFIKKLYAKRLAEAPKGNELPVVLFTAGGTGAGKTSAILQGDSNALDRSQIVYDTNMATYESSKEKVEQALAAGKAVDIILTVRDPIDGFINGALKRAMRQEQEFGTGRAVPILNHASTYIGAPVTVQQLAEDYKDDPRVSVSVLDNSFGKNNAVEISVANANKYVYNSQDELEQILMEVLINEYEKGTISEAVARATAHTSRGDETNRIKPKRNDQGDSKGPEQSGLVYQSVSTRTPSSVGSEDPHLTSGLAVGLESLDKAPALKAKVAKIVSGYMTFKKGPKTTEAIIESFLQQTEANLLWVYDQVPEALRARSKKWYEGGSLVADRWVDKYQGRYTKAQMAAALAVMSPTMPWDINISLSERLVDIYTNNQDSAWDEGMTRVADSIAENNPNRKMMLDATRGKTLAEVEGIEAKGAWMRIYDEAHNPRSYRLPTPEGGFGDIAMTKAGKPSSVAYINGFGPIAKVVSVLQNGNMENISRQLGEAHKVRNFYNNLFDPTDSTSVTIDTHAVAVGLLLPLGASSTEVMNALNGTGGKNAEQGLTGTYSLFAEAYRRAAQARGVLPREMQSITWEAGRGLFNPAFKSAHQKNPAKLKAIWDDFTSGKADIDETRDRIREAAGGIQEPAWTKYDAGLYEGAPASSYTSDVLGVGGVIGTTASGYGSGTTRGVSVNQGTRGSFNLETLTMTMLQGADLSTVIHESGHFYLKMLETLAARADAPQEVKDDYQRTMDWFGVTSNAWQAMNLEQQRPYHEQWAESFERWNMEGKAPSSQLQPIFSRFRAWLVSVYKSIDEFVRLHPAAGKLNDEVRGVFSRLLASQEAIATSESARAYQPLYANAKDAGVSEETYASYIELGQQATQTATDDLQARSLRDMKWLTNARNRAIQGLQATAKETRAKVMLEVTKEVNAEPVYQAMRFLRRGETVDPKTGAAIKVVKGYKLDAKIIEEMYPDTALDSPDLTKLRGMTRSDGLSPEIVANMFGFSSGDAMVREVIEAENMNEKIEGLTDQRMLEEHGDLIDERSVQRAADEAVHNEARAKFMATGLKMLTKSPISVSQLSKAAKAAAETVIANKRVRDVKPKQFLAAETRANKEVMKLVAKNPQEAAEQQRVALLNNRLAAVAQDAVTEVEKALRYLGKFNNEGTRKNLDLEYLEQIDDLLEPFDLRKGLSLRTIDSRTTLAEWITEQEAMGFEPTIDPVAMAEAKTKSYKNMKMSEVRALVDTIKQIEHMGRMKKKLLTAIDRADFLERINEAKISIALNANRVVEEKGTPSDALGILAQWGRQMLASHRKFTSFMRELDGAKWNGALYNLLVRPMATASSTETQMKAEAAERLAELFEPIRAKISSFGNLYNRKRVVPGTMISMTHEQRVMFAMNWGNEGNRQRLLDGGITGKKAMSQQEARAVLDTLTKEEWDFVQGIWDYIGTYKPMIEAQERQLTGKTPEWIEAAQVETKFGTYPGGYFPAKYDAVLSTRSDALEAVTDLRSAMKGAFGSSAARNGYTKERATQVKGRPLLLNFNAISRHTNEVIHRLAWQAWLVDANRVVRALDSDFRTHLGAEATKEISDAIRDIAQGDAPANTPVEVALNRVRTGTSIVAMGWGISTALLQPSGISNSIARIGVRNMTKGLARFMANPMAASDWVNANSVAMQNRGRTMNREMNEVLNTVRAGKGVSAVTGSFFYLTGKFQRMVDVPTYLGAYERALEELKYEEATSVEERASIEKKAHDIAGQTVVDTQGGGEMKDLAKVQRGSPLYKLFTNFYSYMSTVYNQNVEAVRTTDFKDPAEIAAFTAEMLLINFFPVVFSVALKNALKGTCEWDDTECLAGRYQSEQISHLFGQMVGVREVGVSIDAATGGEAFGYTGPAGLRFFADVYKSAIQLNQGEADIALLKALNNALGALFHYPAGQLNKTLEGAIAIENGEVEGAAILPALISGPQK